MRAVAGLCLLLALGSAGARVLFSVFSAEGGTFYRQDSVMEANYGDTITIFCSGTNATKINLTRVDSEDLQVIEIVNTTTVKLTSKELAIGRYKYICDEKTSRAELHVAVYPALTVKSQNVLYQNIPYMVPLFFVPIGEDYELFCSASAPTSLTISKNDKVIETHVVNLTSIKTTKQQEMVNAKFYYSCGKSNYPSRTIFVYVDYPPAPINFHCVIIMDSSITCNWNVRTLETTFTLFHSDKFRNTMRVCEVSSNQNTIVPCRVNVFNLLKHSIGLEKLEFFIMESCNVFVCVNETFDVNRVSFRKPHAPTNLTLKVMSTSQAVVSWRYKDTDWNILQYKVTYQTTGVAASELDESSLLVTCENTERHSGYWGSTLKDCEAKLKLPCPRTRYEIKVYVKESNCPGTNAACWSDPETITLYTGKRGNGTVNPMCDQPIRNKYVAMDKVQKFEKNIDENMSAFSEQVISLQNKLDTIKKLCGELSPDDCKNDVLSKTGGN